MTPSVIADSIVNLCGAIGLGVAMIALHRRDPRGPLTRRLLLALGVAALLFLLRGVAWWSGSAWLDRMSLIPAALVPLSALIDNIDHIAKIAGAVAADRFPPLRHLIDGLK